MQDSPANSLRPRPRMAEAIGEHPPDALSPQRPFLTGAGRIILALLVGVAVATVAVRMAPLSLKQTLLGIFIAAIFPLAAITRQTKPILLVAWILSLTYFRVAYPIPSMAGFQGFYVSIADAVFLLVLAYWAYEAIVLRKKMTAHGPGLLWYFLPFLMACLVSAVLAQRSDWAGYEVVRVAKVALILLYCRYNIGPKEWWICIAALGLAVLAQSGFGLLQVTGLLGNYQLEAWDASLRANGTLAHASILSSYMLLLFPLFLALAVSVRPAALKLFCAATSLAGLVGVALTLSRIPWALSLLEAGGLTLVLLKFRMVKLKHAVGVWSIGMVILGLALLPFLGPIQNRIQDDLGTAVEWRLEMNRVGFDLFRERPFFGIGLANFPLYLGGYNMEFSDSLDDAMAGVLNRAGAQGQQVEGFHWVWVPHNLYILLLAETGMLGLACFLLFLFAGLRAGIRGLRISDPVQRAAVTGLLIGLAGILGHMMSDWAMWLDPLLFTFALVVCLLNNALTVTSPPWVRSGTEA